jgi:outer membrane protein assembly factor BamB
MRSHTCRASRRPALAVGVGLVLAAAFAPARAAYGPTVWPQWRGPTRDGHVGGPPWPASLGGGALKRLWRVGLGPSYSGPVVAPDRVFVTETRDRSAEVVRALDRRTGRELWRAEWKGAITVPSYARVNGDWVRSTPAYDGERLYVAGMRDVLVCLDAATGKERWRVDFVERYKTPLPPYGFACSPLVDGDAVYVQAAAALVKLDRRTGRVLWRVLPYKSSPNRTAVSSPVLATLAGRRQLLAQHPKQLVGVDPQSGDVLWSAQVPAFRSINIVTPTVYKDGVLTSALGGRTFLFRVIPSGVLSQDLTATKAWDNAAQAYMSSPVVVGDHAYLHLRNQRLACLDLRAGARRWVTPPDFGRYWSMVAQGDRVLALDEQGILYLFRASPRAFELLDRRKVSDEETWAHLAVCGDELFVRELHAVAAYRWESTSGDSP